jgi:2-haloacid dehalogenase
VTLDFSRFDVVSFDCYGTLIDWESGILEAVRPVLARHGIHPGDDAILETYAALEAKFEEGEYLRYRMVLRLVMTEMSLKFKFDAEPGELDCLARSIGDWRPFADSVRALKRLAQRYRLAVISNVDDALFARTAERLGIGFDWVVTAEQARAYKPLPEVFEKALERIGRPRDRVLHAAQSVYHDIIPAGSLGIKTVWVNRRSGKPGSGATPAASGKPDLEVPDLAGLAAIAGC